MELIAVSPEDKKLLPCQEQTPAAHPTDTTAETNVTVPGDIALFDWQCKAADAEMQRLFEMLPAPEDAVVNNELGGLGLDLGMNEFGGSTEPGWSWTGGELVGAV